MHVTFSKTSVMSYTELKQKLKKMFAWIIVRYQYFKVLVVTTIQSYVHKEYQFGIKFKGPNNL